MELTIIFAASVLLFLALLVASRSRSRSRTSNEDGAHRLGVPLAGAVSINFAGAFGTAWLAGSDLEYDEPASGDLGLYALLIAILASATLTALILSRRGRPAAALGVAALAAIPTILTYGVVLLWVSHPVLMH